jgi:hypothetical protein
MTKALKCIQVRKHSAVFLLDCSEDKRFPLGNS